MFAKSLFQSLVLSTLEGVSRTKFCSYLRESLRFDYSNQAAVIGCACRDCSEFWVQQSTWNCTARQNRTRDDIRYAVDSIVETIKYLPRQ